ncbi:MAG: hypothetical protein PHO37_09945 [Kiritimatiellae bacterium]|nr:hypothetical protein [Kiritimatiellia bacterium]
MSVNTDGYDPEMPPKQGPEAAAREKFAGGGNLVTMYQAQQGANAESFPVLQAFQEYIEAERKQARKRVVQLSISFAVIIGVVVSGFLAAGVYMMQDTTKRLFQMAEKNAAAVAPPLLAPMAAAPLAAPSSPALEESIRQISQVLAKMQSEGARPPAIAAPESSPLGVPAARNPELDALKAELMAMKEQIRKQEGESVSMRDGKSAVAETKPRVAPQTSFSVEDALEIARKTGAEKTAGDKATAEKLAQAAAEAEKTRLAQIEADQKAAQERTAADARVQQAALSQRNEAEQIAALQRAAASAEKAPEVITHPVADKHPPATPQGVAAPLPPKDMMAVSVPLKTKSGGVVPWRIFVPE